MMRTRGARGDLKLPRTLRLRGEANQFSLRERYTFRTDVLKVLRKSPRLSHLGHAPGRACAKTKKFPCIFLASPPPVTDIFLLENSATPPRVYEAALTRFSHSGLAKASHAFSPSTAKRPRQWKGNFWFCFAVSVSEKSNLILTFCLLFSPPSRRPRRTHIRVWW